MQSANGRLQASQRVLIVNNHLLMWAGVEKLLSTNPGHVQIIGASPQGETDLVKDIWHFLPDVIILSAQSQRFNPTRLLSLLENYGSLRLIAVSETDNSLEIYEKRRIETKQLADLKIAIHNQN